MNIMSTTYTLTIDVDAKKKPDVDDLIDAFEPWHGAIGSAPGAGHVSVTLSVPGETLHQAVAAALAIVAERLPGTPVALQAMTEAEHDRRGGWSPQAELISVTEAAARLGVSRQAILGRIQAGSLTGRLVGKAYSIPAAEVDALAGERAES